jgi:hypothetical protein
MSQPLSAAERGRFVTPPADLLGKLRPFDFAIDRGIRPSHVRAFQQVCRDFDLTLLLRATNPASVPYMEHKGYVAKPIDCKAKTADVDVALGDQWSECGGLVADPSVVGGNAFGGKKLEKAERAWHSFTAAMHRRKLGGGVVIWERAERQGFYAVDTAAPHVLRRHHGCLMVSDQPAPPDFDPAKTHIRAWMARHMAYLHGDYDLYGIIDNAAAQAAAGQGEVNPLAVGRRQLLGQVNFVTEHSTAVQERLNQLIGADMVLHGEQSAYEHAASDVYLFFASGAAMVVAESQFKRAAQEMPAWFESLYRYVFKTGYLGQTSLVAAKGR